jgi:hypothetical protein
MSRKFLLLLLIFSASALALNCQTKTMADEKTPPCKYLSFADAEKILGRRVELVTNSWTFTKDVNRFDCHYRVTGKDQASEQAINLFFIVEESSTESFAEQIYADIWQSNKNHKGVEILSGIGDEAYAHSDKPNFYFLMARKDKFTIRLKVNKAVETVSPEEMKAAARKIFEQL